MQIHAGQYKGRRIKTVKNLPYRPTTSIVRKSLFDILNNISGKTVLDLYAGSGVIGFEAASRGAKQVTFVDSVFLFLLYIFLLLIYFLLNRMYCVFLTLLDHMI